MRPPAFALVLLGLDVLGVGGCGRPLGRAEAQFAEGRYPDAKQTLVMLETESRAWSDAERAEYALYRGMTHASLGDRDQAELWLREARSIEGAHPGSLSAKDVQRLQVTVETNDRP
jgi:hypothetical protein